MSYYRNMVKDMDDSQKLELVSIIIDSMRSAKAEEMTTEEMLEGYPYGRRYTKAELNAMLDEAEAEIAAGGGTPHEEVMREWEEEFADMDKELYTPEESYELTMKDIKAIYEDAAV